MTLSNFEIYVIVFCICLRTKSSPNRNNRSYLCLLRNCWLAKFCPFSYPLLIHNCRLASIAAELISVSVIWKKRSMIYFSFWMRWKSILGCSLAQRLLGGTIKPWSLNFELIMEIQAVKMVDFLNKFIRVSS